VEFLQKRFVVFNQCFYVVLDEGDLMIDMGFEEDVNKILDAIAVPLKGPTEEEAEFQISSMKAEGSEKYRTTQLYSATMPLALENIAKK
jgi:ATP-dependent RNA helicase DDX23/PRP28